MPPARRGTGHINWSDFVNANRGASQRVGQALSTPTEQARQRGEAGLSAAAVDFNRLVGENTLNFDPNRNPTGLSSTVYRGPGSLTDTTPGASGMAAAEEAARGAESLSSLYGRTNLLRENFGRSGYSPGQQRFDSALLQSTNQAGFDALKKSTGGLLDRFTQANADSVGRANTARATTADAARRYGIQEEGAAEWARRYGTPRPVEPAQPQARPVRPQQPQTVLGTTPVYAPQPQTAPITLGNTTIQPPPKRRQGGGQWVGNQWVPSP